MTEATNRTGAKMTSVSLLPIEAEPISVYRTLEPDQVHALLDEALAGLPLGAYDQRIASWLKQNDQPTIVTLASIILRARHQGPTDREGLQSA